MAIALGFAIGGRHDFYHDVAGLQFLAFGFPEPQRLAVAIDAQAAPARVQLADRLAALGRGDLALDQLDTPRHAGKIGEVVGDMFALGAAGKQQPGKADRVDDVVRARLPRERFVVVGADHRADRNMRCERAHGQRDQDRGIVASCGHQHVLRLGDANRLQRLVAGGVRGHDVAAQRFGLVQPVLAGVDDHDAARVSAAFDQLADRFRAGDAVAEDHDVIR